MGNPPMQPASAGHSVALMTGRRSIRRLAALVSSAILALGAAGSISRPVAAGTCQFFCDTLEVVNVPHGLAGTPGTGLITSSDGRINCTDVLGVVQSGSVCSFRYTLYTVTFPYKESVTFQPGTGSYVCLASTCHDEGAPVTVDITLDPPGQTEATYEIDYGFYLSQRTLSIGGTFFGGNVTSSPGGIDCGTTGQVCAALFPFSQQVKLTATPDAGHVFVAWQGDCAAQTTSVCTVAMIADRTTNPVFAPAPTGAPTPTPRPTPTHAAGPTGSPKATANATAALPTPATTTPASSALATAVAAGSAPPATTANGLGSEAPGSGDAGVSQPTGTPAPIGPVGATGSTFDSTPIVLAIVFAAIVIALGIVAAALIGRRRPVSDRR